MEGVDLDLAYWEEYRRNLELNLKKYVHAVEEVQHLLDWADGKIQEIKEAQFLRKV